MRRLVAVATVCVVVGSASLFAQTRKAPKSLYDLYGVSNHATRNDTRYPPVDGSPLTPGLSLVPVYATAPPNILLHSAETASDTICTTAPAYPAWGTVFSETFTTSSAAPSIVEIDYNGQIEIGNSSALPADTVYFGCTVTQASGSTPCSNTQAFPSLLRQPVDPSTVTGHLSMVSYHGFALVDPGSSTTVVIQVTTGTGAIAQACFNNLAIRYR